MLRFISIKTLNYIIFILILFFTKSLLALNTIATHAIIFDYDTGDILFEKNSNEITPPASMTKIMTSYIVFDKIKNTNLSLNDKFIVSSKAYKKGGSRMFLEINSKVTVKDLLLGVIVQSGNDASIALAENISGTEKDFARLMNEYAKKVGMTNTNFTNSSGWPDPKHYSTMKDLAILSQSLINNFPELYKFYSLKKFKYNNIIQPNRNSLLKTYKGTDGLKTGFVKDSGYGIVVSALNEGRRIIVAINGLESRKSRLQEAEKLLNWAYRDTKQFTILEKNQILTKTDVWLGNKKKVDLISSEKLVKALTFEQINSIEIILNYEKPIEAPINKNQKIGNIKIIIPTKEIINVPLIAKEEIKIINPFFRIIPALKYLIFGNL